MLRSCLTLACLLALALPSVADEKPSTEKGEVPELLRPDNPGPDANAAPLRMIVMDPLAWPLSCPCVEGYAQRKYEVLAKHLANATGREVRLVFAEALAKALKETGGSADLIIGKDSVVRFDAKSANLSVSLVGRLTDQQGQTTQYGMIVADKNDPAKSVSDLDGYTVIFGPQECDEKHSAAVSLLESNGVAVPETKTIDGACSDGACKVIKLGPDGKTVAVISSYAAPLLEGCGTIKKGDLKVIAKTEPVPFVAAYVRSDLDAGIRETLQQSLLGLALHPELCTAIESLAGFINIDAVEGDAEGTAADAAEAASKKKTTTQR